MARGILYACGVCHREIEAWSDGNPYFIDEDGQKHYAYHPDHERLAKCVGNDVPHLCLACGAEFMVDSRAPTSRCPKCSSESIRDIFELEGCACPYCKGGTFATDPGFSAIS
jgi:DNA-directed RNA polymerase subunit RPC12/RpoP